MSEKNVDEWLQGLYTCNTKGASGGKFSSEAHSYEKNKTTSEVLNDLKLSNQLADSQADEEIKIAKILQEEFEAECTRMTCILKPVGLDPQSLPDCLLNLVEIIGQSVKHAEQLELHSTDLQNESSDLSGKQMLSLQRLQNLEKVRASLHDLSVSEGQEQIGKKKETEFLSKKINEYAANIRHFEKRLESVDYHSDIRHGNLEKRADEWKLTRDKLAQIRSKLSAYADLTPDINLARVQVQQLKDELTKMESQISDNISNINSK